MFLAAIWSSLRFSSSMYRFIPPLVVLTPHYSNVAVCRLFCVLYMPLFGLVQARPWFRSSNRKVASRIAGSSFPLSRLAFFLSCLPFFLSCISHFFISYLAFFISHLAFFYLASRIFYLASRIFYLTSRIFYLASHIFLSCIFYLASRIFLSRISHFLISHLAFLSRISHLAFLCRIFLLKFFSSPSKSHLECPLQASVTYI